MRKADEITSMTLTLYIPKVVYADNHEIGGQLKEIFINFFKVKHDDLQLKDDDRPLP
jgi:hypothetical protein